MKFFDIFIRKWKDKKIILSQAKPIFQTEMFRIDFVKTNIFFSGKLF